MSAANRREQEAQLWEAHRSHNRLMQQARQPNPKGAEYKAEGPWQNTGGRDARECEGRCRSLDNATDTSSDGEASSRSRTADHPDSTDVNGQTAGPVRCKPLYL